MKLQRSLAVLAIAAVAASSGVERWAPDAAAQTRTAATTVDRPLHNLDLAGSR